MSVLLPIGAFLNQFDSTITTAQNGAVSGVVTAMQAPLASMAVIYFAMEGWKVAAGDLDRLNSFTFTMAKIGLIFMLAANMTAFNTWVVGVFEHGFPDAISRAVTVGASDSTSNTVAGVAGAIDKIWANMWARTATVWMIAGTFDVSSRLIAGVAAVIGSIGLVLDAGVYLIARFLFAIIVVLGPVCIGCAMFPITRPIFERWIGKGVALIVLQVAAIITMQIVLTGSQSFITAPADATADLPTQLQNMISMAIWVLLGAFAIYSLPGLAYSIGSGVAVSFSPIVSAALRGASLAAGALAGGAAVAPVGGPGGLPALSGSGSSMPDINLSMARAEIAGGSGAADASFFGDSSSGLLGGPDGPGGPTPLIPPSTPLLPYEG